MRQDIEHLALVQLEQQADLRDYSQSYVTTVKSALRNYLFPVVGTRCPGEVTPDDIASIGSTVRTRLADSTAEKVLGVVRRTLRGLEGVPEETRQAAEQLQVRSTRRQGQASQFVAPDKRPTTQAVWDLAGAMEHETDQAAVLLGGFAGLRFSEVAGLHVEDADLADNIIRLSRAVTYPGGREVVRAPKGGKLRSVPLLDEIRPWVVHCVLQGTSGEPLCSAPRGGYLRPSGWYQLRMNPAREEAEWPRDDDGSWKWSFHSLRHHFADFLLDRGVDVRDVAHALGHSSPSITMDTYVSSDGGAFDRIRTATSRRLA